MCRDTSIALRQHAGYVSVDQQVQEAVAAASECAEAPSGTKQGFDEECASNFRKALETAEDAVGKASKSAPGRGIVIDSLVVSVDELKAREFFLQSLHRFVSKKTNAVKMSTTREAETTPQKITKMTTNKSSSPSIVLPPYLRPTKRKIEFEQRKEREREEREKRQREGRGADHTQDMCMHFNPQRRYRAAIKLQRWWCTCICQLRNSRRRARPRQRFDFQADQRNATKGLDGSPLHHLPSSMSNKQMDRRLGVSLGAIDAMISLTAQEQRFSPEQLRATETPTATPVRGARIGSSGGSSTCSSRRSSTSSCASSSSSVKLWRPHTPLEQVASKMAILDEGLASQKQEISNTSALLRQLASYDCASTTANSVSVRMGAVDSQQNALFSSSSASLFSPADLAIALASSQLENIAAVRNEKTGKGEPAGPSPGHSNSLHWAKGEEHLGRELSEEIERTLHESLTEVEELKDEDDEADRRQMAGFVASVRAVEAAVAGADAANASATAAEYVVAAAANAKSLELSNDCSSSSSSSSSSSDNSSGDNRSGSSDDAGGYDVISVEQQECDDMEQYLRYVNDKKSALETVVGSSPPPSLSSSSSKTRITTGSGLTKQQWLAQARRTPHADTAGRLLSGIDNRSASTRASSSLGSQSARERGLSAANQFTALASQMSGFDAYQYGQDQQHRYHASLSAREDTRRSTDLDSYSTDIDTGMDARLAQAPAPALVPAPTPARVPMPQGAHDEIKNRRPSYPRPSRQRQQQQQQRRRQPPRRASRLGPQPPGNKRKSKGRLMPAK